MDTLQLTLSPKVLIKLIFILKSNTLKYTIIILIIRVSLQSPIDDGSLTFDQNFEATTPELKEPIGTENSNTKNVD